MDIQLSVKERLLNAALACIEKEGFHKVTIRNIAREANLNSASISYYFGSKENLLRKALERALKNAMDNFKMLDNPPENNNYSGIIRKFFLHNFEGMVNYPEIIRALLYAPFTSSKYDRVNLEWIRGYLESFSEIIKKSGTGSDLEEIRFIVMQIFSALLMPTIFPGIFAKFTEKDLKSAGTRELYIDCLLRRCLPPSL